MPDETSIFWKGCRSNWIGSVFGKTVSRLDIAITHGMYPHSVSWTRNALTRSPGSGTATSRHNRNLVRWLTVSQSVQQIGLIRPLSGRTHQQRVPMTPARLRNPSSHLLPHRMRFGDCVTAPHPYDRDNGYCSDTSQSSYTSTTNSSGVSLFFFFFIPPSSPCRCLPKQQSIPKP
jgi:hypothetical protein